MFANIEVFRTAGAMAAHAGHRQAVLARNVANADTPGYKARDLPAFQKTMTTQPGRFDLRATRAGHLNGTPASAPPRAAAFERAGAPDPNGNTVVLEEELMHAADVRRDHDRALAIYRSALDILRTSIRVR